MRITNELLNRTQNEEQRTRVSRFLSDRSTEEHPRKDVDQNRFGRSFRQFVGHGNAEVEDAVHQREDSERVIGRSAWQLHVKVLAELLV